MSRTVVFLKPLLGEQPGGDRRAARSRRRGRWSASGMLAAHGDDLAGQVRRVVAGQEHHHVGDLPRLGGPAERLALLELVRAARRR